MKTIIYLILVLILEVATSNETALMPPGSLLTESEQIVVKEARGTGANNVTAQLSGSRRHIALIVLQDVSSSFTMPPISQAELIRLCNAAADYGAGATIAYEQVGAANNRLFLRLDLKPVPQHIDDETMTERIATNRKRADISSQNRLAIHRFIASVLTLKKQPGQESATMLGESFGRAKTLILEPQFSSSRRMILIVSDGIASDKVEYKLPKQISLYVAGWQQPTVPPAVVARFEAPAGYVRFFEQSICNL